MLLEMKHLTKYYGKNCALKDLNLKIQPGIYGLLGPNGAGKSTWMKLLCMLLKPTEGEILCDGVPIQDMNREFLKVLGYMPQYSCLYPEFGVMEYLFYIGTLKGISKQSLQSEAETLLKKVRLWDVREQKIKTLSGGMKQRLMFTQALLGDPKVVILDEPTAGLDPQKRIEMRNMIAEEAKDKVILIATHIVSDVELIANQILLLRQGELIASDTVHGLTEQLNGQVCEMEVDTSIRDMEEKYRVSTIYQKAGKTYAKVIVDHGELPQGASLIYPDMEDVYLYHFGEEEEDQS